MSPAPFALLAAALLAGGGIALFVARWRPGLLGGPTLSRPAADPRLFWPAAALLILCGGWTAFTFWQGTRYARLDCVQVERVAEALEQTDHSVHALSRAIGDFADAVDGLHGRTRAVANLPLPRRPDSIPAAAGGPP
jgi:hypothetical protein